MTSVNVTISLPEELYKRMKVHEEISWSATIRKMIEQKMKDLEFMDRLSSKSQLTEEDVLRLSEKIDKKTAKKLGLA